MLKPARLTRWLVQAQPSGQTGQSRILSGDAMVIVARPLYPKVPVGSMTSDAQRVIVEEAKSRAAVERINRAGCPSTLTEAQLPQYLSSSLWYRDITTGRVRASTVTSSLHGSVQ